MTLKFFQYHRFINRGFLIGPCLPIYGSGCALITVAMDGLVLLARSEFSYGTVFAVSFFLCGHTLDDVKHVTVIGPDGKKAELDFRSHR